jgi:microcystin-dependent protein
MPWTGGSYNKGNNATGGWTGDATLGIGIEAGRHDVQDNDFATGINQCLNKDGSNAATGNLNIGGNKITNIASATNNSDAPTYAQLLSIIPAGTITAYGGAAAPSGWLLCNGTNVSRTTYATLFAIIGTTFGVGDGSTTFGVPNLQQRFPLGKAAAGTGSTLGGTGGAIDHNHSVAAHQHTIPTHVHGMGSHTHTVTHSHPLSGSGYAQMQMENTDTYWRRLTGLPSWNATVTKPIAGTVTGNTTAQSHGISLGGNTDSATPTSSGPSVANTDGSGTLTTDLNTSPTVTGNNNPPFLVVNYIIKA